MLTDMQIRKAKPAAKPRKLTDGGGLFLFIPPNGSKLWRQAYRFGSKQLLLSHGAYPDVSLIAARAARDAARDLLTRGIDPRLARKNDVGGNTLGEIAGEYLSKVESEGEAPATLSKKRWLLEFLLPAFKDRAIASITAPELLNVLRKAQGREIYETTRRLRSFFGQLARYAIATGRCERDVSADLRGALISPKVTHRPAITDPAQVGGLLRAIDGYAGATTTRIALRLAAYTFIRPGELRHADWGEIKPDRAVWIISEHRAKMRREHRVPLSRQALELLAELRKLTGHSKYLFPAIHTSLRPISENTLNVALRRMGFEQDEMCSHGFRSIASSLLNESGKWNPDAIERQLGHQEANQVRKAYARAEYWDERVRMMQWWADYLDNLRDERPDKIAA
jgi:integrase